ncbi:PE-PPE domain-containing protein [Mycobacterium sp. ITM-2016-00317]|uniref:PE-PPE domain-containing protein n=1 Tax=Mycobacterium sp. ITM-2016-00317 TaxID=2099694 RepID=UPI00287FA6A1|nr:PE-PPE domain-containing protein [Mycobacterium sp. ITM-2016-00317]WNG90045.1 PE-PPE domain-containing protein [Mycobacterium sp. ITM-2016-00317]
MNRWVTLIGVVAVAFTPAVANGATALLVGGKGGYAELTDEQMSTAFGGFFGDYHRVSVPFPGADDFQYSVEVGTNNLYDSIFQTLEAKPDELITIGGVSEGAPAVDRVLRRLMELPAEDRPNPQRLNAMIYGAPSKLLMTVGGVPYRPLPDTPYNVMIVMAEYDGVTDFPDNPFNLLALLNAVMGGVDLHVDAAWTDLYTVPTKYHIVEGKAGGKTTLVLIQTPLLPMLRPLKDAGFAPEFVAFLDKLLRPIVDSAYNRPKWEVGIPPTLAEMDLSAQQAPMLNPPPAAPELTSGSAPEARRQLTAHPQTLPPAEPAPTKQPEVLNPVAPAADGEHGGGPSLDTQGPAVGPDVGAEEIGQPDPEDGTPIDDNDLGRDDSEGDDSDPGESGNQDSGNDAGNDDAGNSTANGPAGGTTDNGNNNNNDNDSGAE